jgi:hypothetical protein
VTSFLEKPTQSLVRLAAVRVDGVPRGLKSGRKQVCGQDLASAEVSQHDLALKIRELSNTCHHVGQKPLFLVRQVVGIPGLVNYLVQRIGRQ